MANINFSNIHCYQDFIMLFPNPAITLLDEEIKRKLQEKENILNNLSSYVDRKNALKEDLKNIKQEKSHSQALRIAGEKEIKSEAHFTALCEREIGNMRQEDIRLQNELGFLCKKENSHENNTSKAIHNLEKLRHELDCDEEKLNALLAEAKRKEEDIVTIAMYAQQDKNTIKELILSIEKLSLETEQKKKALDNEHMKKLTAQICQERTAEIFQKTHLERQRQIDAWNTIIKQMNTRDENMQNCAKLLAEAKMLVAVQDTQIKRKCSFLAMEVENTREYQKIIASTEQHGERLSSDVKDLEGISSNMQNEMESLRRTVIVTATDLKTLGSKLANIKKKIIKQKMTKLEEAQAHNSNREQMLKNETNVALSAEEAMTQVEQILYDLEKCMKDVEKHLQSQHKIKFLRKQKEQTLIDGEKSALREYSQSHKILSNLKCCITKNDQHLVVQQEISYKQEFQIQLLENKVARMSGHLNSREKQALELQISKLTQVQEERMQVTATLYKQIQKLQNDCVFTRKETEKSIGEKKQLITKIDTLNLFIDAIQKDVKQLGPEKKDKMVETNLLKLEVKQVRALLNNKVDSICSLEKRQLQLEMTMKEHLEEIHLHREMVAKVIKITFKETQSISLEVNERLCKIEKMKSKYEVLTMATDTFEGEEERSDPQYIIKAALEKEKLHLEKDNLSAKIYKMEEDQKLLENTMHIVCCSNSAYEKSLHITPKSSHKYLEKLKLLEEKKTAENKHQDKILQIRKLQENCKSMKSLLDSLCQEYSAQSEKSNEIQARIRALHKEITFQLEKLGRASKQCSKLTKEIRSSEAPTEQEQIINLRQLRDWRNTINTMILQANGQHPDLQTTVQMSFEQANLCLSSLACVSFSRLSSKRSSSCSSASLA